MEQRIEQSRTLQEYKRLADNIREMKQDILNSQSPRFLTQMMEQSSNLFQRVNTTTTLSQDCKTLRKITKTAANQASCVNLGTHPFTIPNIQSKLMQHFPMKSTFDWEQIGTWVLRNSKTAPSISSFLFGLEKFEVVKKDRAIAQRSKKSSIEELQELGVKKKSTEEDKDERMKSLLARAELLCRKLKSKGPIPISQVITEGNTFEQCVENAYELSHLVREGRVAIQNSNQKIIANADLQGLKAKEGRKQCVLHLRDSDFLQYIENLAK